MEFQQGQNRCLLCSVLDAPGHYLSIVEGEVHKLLSYKSDVNLFFVMF